MRHEHLVVTVEAGLKDRIDDDLDGGESLESWVADAVERKLAAEDETAAGGGRGGDVERGGRGDRGGRADRGSDGRDRAGGNAADGERGRNSGSRFATGGGRGENEADAGDGDERDDYDEGFEYVDDCAI
ncbi:MULTISPECIES: hypothetical protein [Halorussus]|uniref:hypothetical protein n=1 Tax=Halorussus TaxID=1070314 RepID=UPI000E214B83|nr:MULTISPECIES: hypothetical protein [Halorussus]NHN57547.1 hypothetical protein [Halorussus sp. JP-T4]